MISLLRYLHYFNRAGRGERTVQDDHSGCDNKKRPVARYYWYSEMEARYS
jgi:hypothetical protein